MSWTWTAETLGRLERFLVDRSLLGPGIDARRIGDGHSNLTYLVSDGEREVVVRRPPPPPMPPGAHDVLREARLIRALEGSGVPVPTVLAVGEAGIVIDVPFYVMNHVPGVVIGARTPAALAAPGHRRALAEAMIDGLADLHAVDWRARGLADFGRPEGFNRRHLSRVARLIAGADGAMPPAFAALHDWLAAHAPDESGAAIVHSDYRLGNLMWAGAPPVRLLAILDWELATIGDPLLDLGYVIACYPQDGEPTTPTQDFAPALREPGFPPRDALVRRYSARSGRDVARLGWYRAMAEWKLAVMYEYSRRRAEDPYYADPTLARRFLDSAARAAGLPPV